MNEKFSNGTKNSKQTNKLKLTVTSEHMKVSTVSSCNPTNEPLPNTSYAILVIFTIDLKISLPYPEKKYLVFEII